MAAAGALAAGARVRADERRARSPGCGSCRSLLRSAPCCWCAARRKVSPTSAVSRRRYLAERACCARCVTAAGVAAVGHLDRHRAGGRRRDHAAVTRASAAICLPSDRASAPRGCAVSGWSAARSPSIRSAGAFAGLAGVMEFSRLSVGDPTVANGAELGVIAAVIIGGGSLRAARARSSARSPAPAS